LAHKNSEERWGWKKEQTECKNGKRGRREVQVTQDVCHPKLGRKTERRAKRRRIVGKRPKVAQEPPGTRGIEAKERGEGLAREKRDEKEAEKRSLEF